jgi:hypothetical protein
MREIRTYGSVGGLGGQPPRSTRRPCHFAGGKMYASLPFDQPRTIRTLGEKLFTRIRDEKERSLLRSFLAQEATSPK